MNLTQITLYLPIFEVSLPCKKQLSLSKTGSVAAKEELDTPFKSKELSRHTHHSTEDPTRWHAHMFTVYEPHPPFAR